MKSINVSPQQFDGLFQDALPVEGQQDLDELPNGSYYIYKNNLYKLSGNDSLKVVADDTDPMSDEGPEDEPQGGSLAGMGLPENEEEMPEMMSPSEEEEEEEEEEGPEDEPASEEEEEEEEGDDLYLSSDHDVVNCGDYSDSDGGNGRCDS